MIEAQRQQPRPEGDGDASETSVFHVELYGVARLLAGEREVALPVAAGMTLGDLPGALAERLPALVGPVLTPARDRLAEGYIFNRNGRDFLTDDATPVRPGDRLLLLASVAGGSGQTRVIRSDDAEDDPAAA
jgi:molybdopterin converting factor small subunit